VARQIHEGIVGSELRVFPNSAHLPFWEERADFRRVVAEFLDSVTRTG
jgi:pimeloyl-ACP methyl ester carboxylesterase